MERLTNIKELGRFTNGNTGKEYNLKSGYNSQRGINKIFYLYRGKRMFVSDKDFYSVYKKTMK